MCQNGFSGGTPNFATATSSPQTQDKNIKKTVWAVCNYLFLPGIRRTAVNVFLTCFVISIIYRKIFIVTTQPLDERRGTDEQRTEA